MRKQFEEGEDLAYFRIAHDPLGTNSFAEAFSFFRVEEQRGNRQSARLALACDLMIRSDVKGRPLAQTDPSPPDRKRVLVQIAPNRSRGVPALR